MINPGFAVFVYVVLMIAIFGTIFGGIALAGIIASKKKENNKKNDKSRKKIKKEEYTDDSI